MKAIHRTQTLYTVAILLSIALSIWVNQNSIINLDGILYLEAARAYLAGGITAAKSIFAWPFYSVIIAWVHQITSLPLDTAAFLLNVILCTLIVTAFITLTKTLGGDYKIQVCAAIIILLHTALNEYRYYVIRDFGHWAFMLYGVYFLIRYAQSQQLRFSFLFGAFMLIAFLFRTEAIIVYLLAGLLLLLPITNLPFKQRCWHTLGSYITLAPLLLIALWQMPSMTELNPWFHTLSTIHYTENFDQLAQQLREVISPHINDKEILYIMIGGFFTYLIIRLFLLLSPVYTFLAGYAAVKHAMTASVARNIVLGIVVIYGMILFGFLYLKLFLAGRYLMPIALLLSLWAPFGLYAILKTAPRYLQVIVVCGLLYMFGDSVVSMGPSKSYIKEAGLWAKDNIPENTHAYTNSREIIYYSDATDRIAYLDNAELLQLLQNKKFRQRDYLIIVIGRNNQALQEAIATLAIQPNVEFTNTTGDRVVVFQRK